MLKPGKKVLSLFLSLFLVIPLLAFSGMQASALSNDLAEAAPSATLLGTPSPTPPAPPIPPAEVKPVLGKTANPVPRTTNMWEITVTVAGKDGTVVDPIGEQFELASPPAYLDNGNLIVAQYNPATKTLSWHIDSNNVKDVVTFKYLVRIKDTANLGTIYPTNGVTTFNYGRESKTFTVPEVTLPDGAIQVKGYLVNKAGKPIDKNGNVVSRDKAVIVYDQPFVTGASKSSKLGTGKYTVGAPVLDHYGLLTGEAGTQDITINPSKPSDTAWFKFTQYMYFIEYYKDNQWVKTSGPIFDKLGANITFDGTAPTGVVLDGYVVDTDKTTPLTLTTNERTNELKVYYKKGNFGYTINYLEIDKDGKKVQLDKTTSTALFASPVSYDKNKKIDGYKFDHADKDIIITSKPDSNVLNVYFVKDTFAYTVEYYKDGEKFDTFSNSALFKDVINDYPDRAPVGYVRSDITGKPLTISSDPAKNVIKVYYVKGTFGYTVNYFKDGSDTPFAQSSLNAKFGDVINSYENKAPTGYVLDTASGLPLTIATVESKNVINVNYKKGSFAYKIEYYKEGSNTPFDTTTSKGIFGDIISAYGDKTPSGYTFSRVVGGPLTISENEGNNIIKVYYKLVPVTPTTGESSNKTLLPMLFACGSLCGGLVIKKESLRKKTQA